MTDWTSDANQALTLRLGAQQRDASFSRWLSEAYNRPSLTALLQCYIVFDSVHASEDTSPDDPTAKPFHPKFTYPVAYSGSLFYAGRGLWRPRTHGAFCYVCII